MSLSETSLKGLGEAIHRAPRRLVTLNSKALSLGWQSCLHCLLGFSPGDSMSWWNFHHTFLISSKALEFCLDLLLDPIRSWNPSVLGHLHFIDVQEWESCQSSALSTWGCYQEGIGGPGATLQPLAWRWRVCQLWYQFFCHYCIYQRGGIDAAKPYHCLSLLYAPAIYHLLSPIILARIFIPSLVLLVRVLSLVWANRGHQNWEVLGSAIFAHWSTGDGDSLGWPWLVTVLLHWYPWLSQVYNFRNLHTQDIGRHYEAIIRVNSQSGKVPDARCRERHTDDFEYVCLKVSCWCTSKKKPCCCLYWGSYNML